MAKAGFIIIPKRFTIFGSKNIEMCYGMEFDTSGNTYNNDVYELAFDKMGWFIDYIPSHCSFAVGMDRGWDEMLALHAIIKQKSLFVFVPGSLRWHKTRNYPFRQRAIRYDEIIESAKEVLEIPKKYKGKIYRDRYIARANAMIEWATDIYSCQCDDDLYLSRAIELAKSQNKYRGDLLNEL
jgi:hypothetical protein